MMSTRERVLITGATGLLGATIVQEWLPRWRITALARRHRVVHPTVTSANVDLCDSDEVMAIVGDARPAVVLHCAAWTDLDGCERAPDEALRIHRDATSVVAHAAKHHRARLIYVSTDSIFASGGLHREDDPAEAQSVYAQTKLEGERVAQAACAESLILRTCIVGWNAQRKLSLVEWILGELRANKEVFGFEDVFFTPILCNAFARNLEALLAKGTTGVLHMSGSECISKYAFAVAIAEVFGLERGLIRPGSIENAKLGAPRPRHPCLDSSQCVSLLATRLPRVRETLREMLALEASGWVTAHRALVV